MFGSTINVRLSRKLLFLVWRFQEKKLDFHLENQSNLDISIYLWNFMKQESLLQVEGKFGKNLKKYQVFSKYVFPDFSVFLFFNSLF